MDAATLAQMATTRWMASRWALYMPAHSRQVRQRCVSALHRDHTNTPLCLRRCVSDQTRYGEDAGTDRKLAALVSLAAE